MALVRMRPSRPLAVRNWNELGNVYNEFDRLFNEMAGPLMGRGQMLEYPADLYETSEALVLEMAVPGLRAEDLDVGIEGRQLTIKGKLPEATDDEERHYWFQGIPRGEFTRTVTLPTTVETDNIEAKVKDGLLSLSLPKVAEAKAKKIAITGG